MFGISFAIISSLLIGSCIGFVIGILYAAKNLKEMEKEKEKC